MRDALCKELNGQNVLDFWAENHRYAWCSTQRIERSKHTWFLSWEWEQNGFITETLLSKLSFYFVSQQIAMELKGGKCNSKDSKILPSCIPFQWLSFGKRVPDPTPIQAPTVHPCDSHLHLGAKGRSMATRRHIRGNIHWEETPRSSDPILFRYTDGNWGPGRRLSSHPIAQQVTAVPISNLLLFSEPRWSLTNM